MNVKTALLNLHQRPIAYYPVYRDLTGSTTAAILLSQLLYWYSACKGKEFYKTDKEIQDETRLTERELRTAKKKLKDCSFVFIDKKGVPCRTFYSFDLSALFRQINQTSLDESSKLDGTNRPSSTGQYVQTITETTNKTTTERETLPKNPKIELDYTPAFEFLISYLKENPGICSAKIKAANFSGASIKASKALEFYLNKLLKEGKFFELTVPVEEGPLYQWIAKRLAGWQSYMTSWASNERTKKGKEEERPKVVAITRRPKPEPAPAGGYTGLSAIEIQTALKGLGNGRAAV